MRYKYWFNEEITPKGEAKDAAITLATKVAKQSPVAVSACKALIQKNRDMPISQALPQERQALSTYLIH